MIVREVRARGPRRLELTTRLLQRARLADADAGLWEAADMQWWWRMPRRSDDLDQWFWLDGEGPVAAVVVTDWGDGWQYDPMLVPGTSGVSLADVWSRTLETIGAQRPACAEVMVRDDDAASRTLALASGFVESGEPSGIAWLDAADRPPPSPPAAGFTLLDRTQDRASPHPMRARNGAAVERRLRECSLYDATLDLAIRAPGGDIAGYALFWLDPVTRVGLLEPMRVEQAYQRRGLARALLAAGIERLCRRGALRAKVGWSTGPARALYEGSGFATTATSRVYRRTLRTAEAR